MCGVRLMCLMYMVCGVRLVCLMYLKCAGCDWCA